MKLENPQINFNPHLGQCKTCAYASEDKFMIFERLNFGENVLLFNPFIPCEEKNISKI